MNEDRTFARAIGWSVAGHLLLAVLCAPFVADAASSLRVPPDPARTEVTYDFTVVSESAWAMEPPSARSRALDAMEASPMALPVADRLEAPALPPASNRTVPAVEPSAAGSEPQAEPAVPRAVAPELVLAVAPSPPEPVRATAAPDAAPGLVTAPVASPQIAPAYAAISAPSAPSRPAGLDAGRSSRDPVSFAPTGAGAAHEPSVASGVRGGLESPRSGSSSAPASSVPTPGVSSPQAENLLAAYRSRVVAWLQPRVERRFKLDPDGRAADAADRAVVQLQVTIDGAGHGVITSVTSPTPALERIVHDVVASSLMPPPPPALAAPVLLRLRIRFTLT